MFRSTASIALFAVAVMSTVANAGNCSKNPGPPQWIQPIHRPIQPPVVLPVQPPVQPPVHQPCRLGVAGQMTQHGLLVQTVEPHSLACRARVQAGDLIVQIQGYTITCQNVLRQAMQEACHCGTLRLVVCRTDQYNITRTLHLSTSTTQGSVGVPTAAVQQF